MRLIFLLIAAISPTSMFAARPALAEALDGKAIIAQECVVCHDLAGPAPDTFEAVLDRKAPDLFYAGSKFNRSWLIKWLQAPTIIRRAGVMFLNHIADDGGRDKVLEDTVKPCAAALSPEEAEAAANFLMTLKNPDMRIGVTDPAKKFRKQKAFRLFTKQLPCIGCHRIKFGKRTMGGISGPDLTNAGERLNADWIYARIENPQYWDPRTWMPRVEMSHRKREMLTLFISSMK
jgi:cbb3-type cytochrome oxidase cytochrome c subunit